MGGAVGVRTSQRRHMAIAQLGSECPSESGQKMRMFSTLRLLAFVFGVSLMTSAAMANTITPVGNNGSLTLGVSNTDSSLDVDNGLSTPGTYNYGDSFGSAAAGTTFYDSFLITVEPGQLDAITTTINIPLGGASAIGISGLESRLFSFTPGPGIAIPTTTPPQSGTLINGWTNVVIPAGDSTGYVNVLTDPSLAQGTYVFQIEGVPLSNGGSYGGSVDLSPVPLPAPWILMGLGLLVLIGPFMRPAVRPAHQAALA
jgi:hypothetical protein